MRENQIKYCHFCRLYKRLFPIAIDLHRKYIHLKPWCIDNSIWDLKAIPSHTLLSLKCLPVYGLKILEQDLKVLSIHYVHSLFVIQD